MVRMSGVLAILLALAAPAWAGEQDRPRLVIGGVDPTQSLAGGDVRTELFSAGGFTAGAMSAPAFGSDRLAVGGYMSMDMSDYRVGSSFRGDGSLMSADVTAAYAGSLLGIESTTLLRLGADWSRPPAFSLNPSQPGSASLVPGEPAGDLNLSLSWTHDVTPGLSLGGVATHTRPLTDPAAPPGFSLGAGLGYKF